MNRFGDIDCEFKQLPPVYGYHSQPLVSIEKALESIEPIIDQLPRYIKIAKTHCRFPSEHGLSKDESAAIYIYTMEWGETTLYRMLNQALRSENRQALKIWFPFLKLFDTALEKLPTVKEVIWRGVPLDVGGNYRENQIVTWWSVNSCSSSVNVIKDFLRDTQKSTLFLIEANKGKRISGYTQYENENEIILQMGTRFRVKCDALRQPNGSYVVHLVEIDDDNYGSLTSAMKTIQVNTDGDVPLMPIDENTKWKQDGITVAGGNGPGNQLNQLNHPSSIYVDDENQSIYIADYRNHRVVQWKYGARNGKVLAGGKGSGNRNDQLHDASDLIIDRTSDSLLVCDFGNRRVVRWSRINGTNGQTIISNIQCSRLTMDHQGSLYVSDLNKHAVIRYEIGKTNGTIVAGGNGQGNRLNQLEYPAFIFVDRLYSIYISDWNNHRVMKWMNGAKEGIIVAGGQGQGNQLIQLDGPTGLFVDHWENIYICDSGNNRVMCWSKGSKSGRIVVGGNGKGNESNQLFHPEGLAFDREGHLYVSDYDNSRIQKFHVEFK